jgi:ABC-type phosphate transport system substrate-binding protein
MEIRKISSSFACAGLLVALTAGGAGAGAAPGAAARVSAGGYAAIAGSGSSYAAPSIFRWAAELASRRLAVSFNPDGSAQGRLDYMQGGLVDFAASDVAFYNGKDKLGGEEAQHPSWGYDYLPDVADDVAFPYHLAVHGHPITNLRLSGPTLMEIFTGQITNWDNPQITRDYGSPLPNLPIIPVINSESAGTTYFFTRWMAYLFPRQWNTFCDRVHPGITPPCGPTDFYPHFGRARAEDGSASVAGYIASAGANGAIGYAEYPYALAAREPVLALRNPAGDYVRPTPVDVTTALTAALINNNPQSLYYLQENLDPVYTFKNPASYPLSDYSYLIAPRAGTQLPPIFTTAAGRSLSVFAEYALCRGQAQQASLGIAPLPANLIAGGLREIKRIPGHVGVPTLAACTAEASRP